MGWPEFERILEQVRARYYLTQVTAPTLRNDLFGVFLAKSLDARTIAFGTHVTPLTLETLRRFPALDFVLRGEPEMTLRELLDTLEGRTASDPRVAKMLEETRLRIVRTLLRLNTLVRRHKTAVRNAGGIAGLAWRYGEEIVLNPDRPFIPTWTTYHAGARDASAGQTTDADDQGAIHLHRHESGLSGGM
jgi:radical SAM superfamily enzyme YgiQ (UPF0313 family)